MLARVSVLGSASSEYEAGMHRLLHILVISATRGVRLRTNKVTANQVSDATAEQGKPSSILAVAPVFSRLGLRLVVSRRYALEMVCCPWAGCTRHSDRRIQLPMPGDACPVAHRLISARRQSIDFSLAVPVSSVSLIGQQRQNSVQSWLIHKLMRNFIDSDSRSRFAYDRNDERCPV